MRYRAGVTPNTYYYTCRTGKPILGYWRSGDRVRILTVMMPPP